MEEQQEGWGCFPAQNTLGTAFLLLWNFQSLGFAGEDSLGNSGKGGRSWNLKWFCRFQKKLVFVPLLWGWGRRDGVCCIHKNQQITQMAICSGASLTNLVPVGKLGCCSSISQEVLGWNCFANSTSWCDSNDNSATSGCGSGLRAHTFACAGPSRNDLCLGGWAVASV